MIETKKHKDVEHKDAGKKLKTESKQHDSKKKEKGHKAAVKTSSNTVADKSSNKTSDDKITNTNGTVVKKENSTKGKSSACHVLAENQIRISVDN